MSSDSLHKSSSPNFSNDVDSNGARKIRSCDVCRKRKVRCDGDPATEAQCTTCETLRTDCTYLIAAKNNLKQRTASASVRVKQLEERKKHLEELIKRFLPQVDLSGDIDLDALTEQVELPDLAPFKFCRQSGEDWNIQSTDGSVVVPCGQSPTIPAFMKGRFFGKSSSAVLVRSTFEWKAYGRDPDENDDESGPMPFGRSPNFLPSAKWNVQPWEEQTISPSVQPSDCSFPEDDLMSSLIDLYFDHVNLFTPLLHRPTFGRLIEENMHFQDAALGSVVLLVCAIGSRFSDDPRVLVDGATTLSAGWKWFREAQEIQERLCAPASLYEIQASVLRAEFLRGAYSNNAAWSFLGIGLRRAQDVGAHRWDTFGTEQSTERELWNRAWWCLVVLDRIASTVMGQPCITEGWDFDVGYPTDCDDEFWDHPDPAKSWKQPEGVPSKISFFISHIKQTQMLAGAQGFLYALDKAKRAYMLDAFPGFDRRVVMELDSALNKWIDNIPDHLRNPHSLKDPTFHRQSIVLHAELYFLQILMHRPFLTSPDKESPMTGVSIAICTNAARACSRLLDTEDVNCRNVVYRIQWPIFSSAVVLLLSVWTGKRMGLEGSYSKEMQNVEKCCTMLSHSERCWQSSGQLVDMIRSLVGASDLVLPSSAQSTGSYSSPPGTQSASPSSTTSSFDPQMDSMASLFNNAMPLYTEDLAKIPMFPGLPVQEQGQQSFPGVFLSSQTGTGGGEATELGTMFAHPPQGSAYQQRSAPPPTGANESFGLDLGPMPPDLFNLDPETMAIWSGAPHGLNFGDWDAFVDNVNEVQMSSNMGGMRMT